MDATLLVVGTDTCVATSWIEGLTRAGAVVETVVEGADALRRLEELDPDVVLLDVHLSGRLDGFETCRGIRALSAAIVVFVATDPEPYDEVVALAVGGDHYFSCRTPMPIVVARLRSLLRRARGSVMPHGPVRPEPDAPAPDAVRPSAQHGPDLPSATTAGPLDARATERDGHVAVELDGHVAIELGGSGRGMPEHNGAGSTCDRLVDGDLEIDLVAREVRVDGALTSLTRTEFDLLVTLASEPRRVFTREQLLERVWDVPFDGSHVLDAHMSRLRGKIGEAGGGRVAFAVRGVGFRLRG